MPQPIYMPRYSNPWEQYLPQFLSQLILQDQSQKFRERMLETERAQKAQEAGYTTEPEITPETTVSAPGIEQNIGEPGFTANLASGIRKPDLMIGGKGYYAPKSELGKPVQISGTTATAVPIVRNGKVVNYQIMQKSEETPEQALAGEGIYKIGDFMFRKTPQGWLNLGSVKDVKGEAAHYELTTLANPKNMEDKITLRRSSPDVDTYLGKGWVEVKTPTTKIDVNMPDTVTPKVKSDLQTKMADADEALDALNQVQDPKLFKREYLEYFGKGKAKAAEYADKFGIDVANQYLNDYTGWKSLVDKQTFAYRKAVTGVAGGEKEMESIQKTYINTSTDSPVMFQAKARVMAENTRMAKERAQYTLEYFPGKSWKELTPQQKLDVSKKFPFITSVTLTKEDVANQEADEYLRSIKR